MTMTVPEHVPEKLVYHFDHVRDEGVEKEPHLRFLQVAEMFPDGLFYSSANGGHWLTTNYEYYSEIALNTEVFSSQEINIPPSGGAYRMLPINLDPPEHAKYRMVLARKFGPKNIRDFEGDFRSLAKKLADDVVNDNQCEFVTSVAELFPVTVFMQMLDLPLDRLEEFRELAVTVLTSQDQMVKGQAIQQVVMFMTEYIAARQQQLGDDIISDLVRAEIDGRPTTMEELQSFCLLLFLAGLDTVVNAMTFGVRHLAGDKDLQRQIRENPEIAAAFAEESLRRYSFVSTGRIVTKDHDFHGQILKKGDMVLLNQIPANLDPKAFPEPLEFKLKRPMPKHVAFNVGPHNCLGMHLARLELAVFYQEWCKCLPDFSLNESKPAEFAAGPVIGVRTLHIKW